MARLLQVVSWPVQQSSELLFNAIHIQMTEQPRSQGKRGHCRPKPLVDSLGTGERKQNVIWFRKTKIETHFRRALWYWMLNLSLEMIYIQTARFGFSFLFHCWLFPLTEVHLKKVKTLAICWVHKLWIFNGRGVVLFLSHLAVTAAHLRGSSICIQQRKCFGAHDKQRGADEDNARSLVTELLIHVKWSMAFNWKVHGLIWISCSPACLLSLFREARLSCEIYCNCSVQGPWTAERDFIIPPSSFRFSCLLARCSPSSEKARR